MQAFAEFLLIDHDPATGDKLTHRGVVANINCTYDELLPQIDEYCESVRDHCDSLTWICRRRITLGKALAPRRPEASLESNDDWQVWKRAYEILADQYPERSGSPPWIFIVQYSYSARNLSDVLSKRLSDNAELEVRFHHMGLFLADDVTGIEVSAEGNATIQNAQCLPGYYDWITSEDFPVTGDHMAMALIPFFKDDVTSIASLISAKRTTQLILAGTTSSDVRALASLGTEACPGKAAAFYGDTNPYTPLKTWITFSAHAAVKCPTPTEAEVDFIMERCLEARMGIHEIKNILMGGNESEVVTLGIYWPLAQAMRDQFFKFAEQRLKKLNR